MTHIILVDDQQLVRNCLRLRLESIPKVKVVGEASNGEDARALVMRVPCDLVLMDLHMPGMGGLEATRRLLAAEPELRVIGLSMYVGGPYPRKFMQIGGAGYVSKYADTQTLVNAIETVEAGHSFVSADVARAFSALDGGVGGLADINDLSRREIQVLHQISEGLTITEIARRMCLSPKTVAHHRRSLFTKLAVQNDVQLANVARTQGLTEIAMQHQ